MSDTNFDPYRVLGVSKSATADDLKKAYRKLSREHHPDRTGGDDRRFKEINTAYQMVGDADKRKLYDEFGPGAFRPGFDPEQARRFKQFGGGGGSFGFGPGAGFDMEDLLSMFGGGRFRSGPFHRGPRRGQDLGATLVVTLLEALEGSTRGFSYGGGGTVKVKVPKGVRSGQRLRVRGKGAPGVDGGPPGDLVLEVTVADHPLVRIDRDDLEMELPLTFAESILGGPITVPTPTGTVKVKIPARAEAGTRMRLKGRGLPKGGADTKQGDLYLVLRPTPPSDGGPNAEKLAAQLAELYGGDVRAALQFGE